MDREIRSNDGVTVEQQIPLPDSARADRGAGRDGTHEVSNDLAYKRLAIVNTVFYGQPGAKDRTWLLIDAGVPGSARFIMHSAERRFGHDSRPAAIILTHGHFDHVGALEELSERWDVPVYAHELELPYLNGMASYPPPDPTVGGGLMSVLSRLYPRGPVNAGSRLQALPMDGAVPGMVGWEWLHTPGHTPGHVALWHSESKTLIAGDAVITTRQESAYAVAVQASEMHGPPMYYTQDWENSKRSVQMLAELEPELVITGHGVAVRGPVVRSALKALVDHFDELAVPRQGRYVGHPVRGQEAYVSLAVH
jgi:glyoxylase-like metal-dependent hydrolase (beta-lactamase superfamily II)